VVVGMFGAGLLRGWEAAAGPTEEVARELVSVEPEMGNVPTAMVLFDTLQLARGREPGEQRFGWMESSRWEGSRDVLARFAGLRANLDVQSCFTNEFVEAYYAHRSGE
jgi:hypothetical protein